MIDRTSRAGRVGESPGNRSASAESDSVVRAEHSQLSGRREILVFLLIALSILAVSYVLNAATPLSADDDYSMGMMWGSDEVVHDLKDIIRSEHWAYDNFTGRVLGHSLAQVFMLLGKPAFNVLNSLGFLLLTLLIYFNAKGLGPHRLSLLIAIPLLLWFSLPAFGQSVLWLTGAANYMWTTIVALSSLLPFRLNFDHDGFIRDSLPYAASALGLGALAGMTNENIAPALAVAMFLYLVLYGRRGIARPRWAYASLVGVCAGGVFMLAAPGNYARIAAQVGLPVDTLPGLPALIDRLLTVTHLVFLYGLFTLLVLYLVMYIAVKHVGGEGAPKLLRISTVYIAAAFCAMYAMVLSPQLPTRSITGPAVFLLVGAASVYYLLDFNQAFVRELCSVTIACATLLFATQFAYAYFADISPTRDAWAHRLEYIQEQRAQGTQSISVPPIPVAGTRHNGLFELSDLSTDPNAASNVELARYLGVKSIAVRYAMKSDH